MSDADSNPTLQLMHALGWQGGTIHQVCRTLGCEIEDILYKGPERFATLLAKAQQIREATRKA